MFGAGFVPVWEQAWRFFFVLLLVAGPARAESFHGLVYEAGTGRKTPLYSLKRTEAREPDGTHVIEGSYTPLNAPGRPVFHQIARVKNRKLLKYIEEQNQLQAWGTLEPRGQKIHFEWVDGKHQMHAEDEETPSNLIVSATATDFLRDHWGDLLDGKGLDVRFAVLDRQETVGFQFSMSARAVQGGREVVRVRMKPTAFFVQMAVKPIEMVFDRKSVRLLELRGYVGLKKRVGNAWKDLDAEMVYEYDDGPVSTPQSRR